MFGLALLGSKLRTSRNDLPPGPKGLPLVGNALQMPFVTPWVTYRNWAKEYGDVMHVSVFGQPIIFLSSLKATRELLESRSAIYSDRPKLTLIGELVGYKDSLPLCAYGDAFREQRKLIHELMGPLQRSQWCALLETKTKQYLQDLLHEPHSFRKNIQRLVAEIAFDITHGHTVQRSGDQMLAIASQADHHFALAIAPGAYFCDVLPILRYIPEWTGVRFQRHAKEFRATMEAIRDVPYDGVKEQVARGTAKPSFTARLIQRNETPTPEQELIYKWASTSLYVGEISYLTTSALESFFLAMTLYPDVQRKAQEELNRVVGTDRLPSVEDRPNLPYIRAMVWELHRWNPTSPLAIPHRCTQEDTYKGFRIPAGSIVFANSWAILHDETIYPSPMTFIPDRYLDPAHQGDRKNPEPKFAFGYGRRVCPGRDLAEDIIFVVIAMILATFNLRRPKSMGKVEQDLVYTSSLLCHPPHYECEITPRSLDATALVLLSVADD
ncbi:cytochrome P450 [Mycena olivaceomarginata]|nr:cytochrome P450 [Mycena olivaceomarginata]